MIEIHQCGCLCENCQMTRAHWSRMGMDLPEIPRRQAKEATRSRTEILSEVDLRATWASTMTEISTKEARRAKP
jgi:hypothetical protein